MKDEFKIIMLPCEESSKLTLFENNELDYHDFEQFKDKEIHIPQHLYIISDDDIIENDWYIDDTNAIRLSFTSDKEYWSTRGDYKKIISSTDKSLDLPWIDDSFVSKYIYFYNKKNLIKFVELEMMNFYDGVKHHSDKVKIKNDGSVIISYNEPVFEKRKIEELVVIPKSIIDIIKNNKDACSINDVIDLLEQNNVPLKDIVNIVFDAGARSTPENTSLINMTVDWTGVREDKEKFIKKKEFEI